MRVAPAWSITAPTISSATRAAIRADTTASMPSPFSLSIRASSTGGGISLPRTSGGDIEHPAHVKVPTARFEKRRDFVTRVHTLKLLRTETTGSAVSPVGSARPQRWSEEWWRSRRTGTRWRAGTRTTWVRRGLSASRARSAMSSRSPARPAAARCGPKTDRRKRPRKQVRRPGALPRQPNDVKPPGEAAAACRDFVEMCFGARVTELIPLDTKRLGGCLFKANIKSSGLVCIEKRGGPSGPPMPPTQRISTSSPARGRHHAREWHVYRDRIAQAFVSGLALLVRLWPTGSLIERANAGARPALPPGRDLVVGTGADRIKCQAGGRRRSKAFIPTGRPTGECGMTASRQSTARRNWRRRCSRK